MSKRYVQIFFSISSDELGVVIGKQLITNHHVAVSYHFSDVKSFYSSGSLVRCEEHVLVLAKGKHTSFDSTVLPHLQIVSANDIFSLPIFDMIADYEVWIDSEIVD